MKKLISKKTLVSKRNILNVMRGVDKGFDPSGLDGVGFEATGYKKNKPFSGIALDGVTSVPLMSISVPENSIAFVRVDTFLKKQTSLTGGIRRRSAMLVNNNGVPAIQSAGFASVQNTPFYVEVLANGQNFEFILKPQVAGEDAKYEVYINWTIL